MTFAQAILCVLQYYFNPNLAILNVGYLNLENRNYVNLVWESKSIDYYIT